MPRKPRILELIYGNTLGGAEVLLREMLRVADRERFEWHLGVLRRAAPWEAFEPLSRELGFGLHLVECRAALDLRCLRGLTRLMRETEIDVVHTHLFRADFHGRWAARRAGVPVVLSTVHNFERFLMKWHWSRVARWSAHQADHIIGCTESVAADVQARLRLPPGQVISIPNGTPLGPFLEPRDTSALRRELALADGEPVVGTIGRLSEQKHHTGFLKMARGVAAQRPETRFLVVGDGPLRAELEREAAALGLAERVIFTGPRSDIPDLLALMDVFVLSSLWEGLPVTVLEAMASGTPCVVTDVGGCRDVVKSGETGWLVAPRDPGSLTAAVLEALGDPARTRAITARARTLVVERHSIERFTRAHEDLCELLLKKKGRL